MDCLEYICYLINSNDPLLENQLYCYNFFPTLCSTCKGNYLLSAKKSSCKVKLIKECRTCQQNFPVNHGSIFAQHKIQYKRFFQELIRSPFEKRKNRVDNKTMTAVNVFFDSVNSHITKEFN